ncbi:MAG: hypothetical protein RLZZ106_1065 [Cyanobacteriota bacterium]|jgi:hypothetical protein
MGPDLGLGIFLPALLISAITVMLSAKQERELQQKQRPQASSCNNPIWPPANKR